MIGGITVVLSRMLGGATILALVTSLVIVAPSASPEPASAPLAPASSDELRTLAVDGGKAFSAARVVMAAKKCPAAIRGTTATAPGKVFASGVSGTSTADLRAFATRLNEIRVQNCLPPIPFRNIRYDECMERRLVWMAEDPSANPMSAWGHRNQATRSDGVADVGCDGNLAGGSGNTGATVAQKWWTSAGHRASLYKPTSRGSMATTCILFAMTHGGVPNEPSTFTRAAARWVRCP